MSAELHVFGQLVGFQLLQSQSNPFSDQQFFAHFRVEHGPAWQLLAGQSAGLTASSDGVWSHPLDLHLACDSIQGWPRLRFQVFRERLSLASASGTSGDSNLASGSLSWLSDATTGALSSVCTPYAQGVCYLPARPGQQTLTIPLTQITSLGNRPSVSSLFDHPFLDSTNPSSPSSSTQTGVAAVAASLDPVTTGNQPTASLSTNTPEQSPLDYQLESRMLIRLDLFIINRNFKRFGVFTH
jgi:hypothetical protein